MKEVKLYWNGDSFWLSRTYDQPLAPGFGTTHIYTVQVPDSVFLYENAFDDFPMVSFPDGYRVNLSDVLQFRHDMILPKSLSLHYPGHFYPLPIVSIDPVPVEVG